MVHIYLCKGENQAQGKWGGPFEEVYQDPLKKSTKIQIPLRM
jgi:hypothetical protein